MRRSLTWSEHLLLSWIAAPCVFFQIWAVKGFQYLLPVAVPVAVLAAMVVVSLPVRQVNWRAGALTVTTTGLRAALALALVASLAATSWVRVQPAGAGSSFLAGTGGVPGGREAGEWVAENVPAGAGMLALGPSMANIIQFYGHRKVLGLSVSPNPLYRNPVYEPVQNPDLQIREEDVKYLVWDSSFRSRAICSRSRARCLPKCRASRTEVLLSPACRGANWKLTSAVRRYGFRTISSSRIL